MKVDPIRLRWRDHSAEDVPSSELIAGDLFRRVGHPRARSTEAVAAMLGDIRRRERTGHPSLFQRTLLIRRTAVAFSAFLSVNFAMAVTVPSVKRWWSTALGIEAPRQATTPVPSVATPPNPARAHEVATAIPDVAQVPTVTAALETPPARSAIAPDASRRRPHPDLGAAAPAPTPTAAVGIAESELISSALTAIKQGKPEQALASVASYRQQFPNGSLGYEATLAEVKAEMASGRSGQALAALERVMATPGFDELPRSREMALLHAELAAQAKDCERALPEFERLATAPDLAPAFAERALYGRAACFASQGDFQGNQAALRDYLGRFPSGRFAPAAREGLSRGE